VSLRHFDWLMHHALARPTHAALIDLGSGRHFTYASLDGRVARLAGYLRDRRKIRRGDRVAVLAHNCSEHFELMFACARLGAIYLPLNWRLTIPELAYILRDAEPGLLAVDDACADHGERLRREHCVAHLWNFGGLAPVAYEQILESADPLLDAEELSHDDVQMLMYTSGTTGFPKGAMITFGMTFWNAVNVGIPAGISPNTRVLSVMPLFHTGGLNLFANPVFHAGGTVLLMRAFDPAAMLAALTDPMLAISHIFAVPTAYQMMAQRADFAGARFEHLELACVGGAATPAAVLNAWQERGVRLANGYGMTETSPAVTLLLPQDALRKSGSVGCPLLHTEIKVVNRGGRECAANESGELWVRGPNVSPGYWRNAEATQEAFCDGWLRTGDVVRRDRDGFCYILDRAKDMYISGGENVYPAEVENVLSSLPEVAEAAVIGLPDDRWGESGLAFLALRPGVRIEADQVLAFCAERLARFKLPREIVFVDALPRTGTGKIHKPTLRENYRSRVRQC